MPVAKHDRLSWIARIVLSTLILAAIQGPNGLSAATIKWQTKPYSHYAQQADIKSVLTDFFASQGIGVVCSEEVTGVVSGNFTNENPRTFFTHLADAYNLIWYYDGAAVFVYSAHEMTSQVVNLGYVNMTTLQKNLVALDILDPKFNLRMIDKDRILYVAGPQRYVDLVSELALQLDAKAMAQRGRDDIVKVFNLKYAWAEDKEIAFRDKEMIIPGVATLLKSLITGQTSPGQVHARNSQQLNSPLSKLKGQGLARNRASQPAKSAAPSKEANEDELDWRYDPDENLADNENGSDSTNPAPIAAEQSQINYPPVYVDTDIGFVQADPRQNAIVVRDREEKMPYYQEIIDLLDVPVGLVEIKATIMDIDRNDMEKLGVEWEFTTTNREGDEVVEGGLNTNTDDGHYTQEVDDDGNPLPLSAGLNLPLGNGLNLATIIGDSTNYFLAKVFALQEKGHAKILSRPSVLTINNIEAQLEHSKTFYVRLAGTEEVDLYDVNVGVVLRVTPHIIEDGDKTMIKLAIQIEDGDIIEGEQVDDIPVVKKSVVNTQAVVGENESLLIGGYLKERNIHSRQMVPCLGDIPIIGWLFKTQSTTGDEAERLFLITPTIKSYGTGANLAEKKNRQDNLTLPTLKQPEIKLDNNPSELK